MIWTASSVAFGKGVGKKRQNSAIELKLFHCHWATKKREKQKENFSKSGCIILLLIGSKTCKRRLYLELMRNDKHALKGISNLSKAENKSLYCSTFLTKKENNVKFDDARKFKSVLLTQQINRALTFFSHFQQCLWLQLRKKWSFFYFKDWTWPFGFFFPFFFSLLVISDVLLC